MDKNRIKILAKRVIEAAPHLSSNTLCPYQQCRGIIPDLWAEWTQDPNGIQLGKVAIDCYYCRQSLIYERITAKLREMGVESISVLRRSKAKMLIYFDGREEALEETLKRLDEQGFVMINKAGIRAFEGYLWA